MTRPNCFYPEIPVGTIERILTEIDKKVHTFRRINSLDYCTDCDIRDIIKNICRIELLQIKIFNLSDETLYAYGFVGAAELEICKLAGETE